MYGSKSKISIKKSIEISMVAASFAALGYFGTQKVFNFSENFNTESNEHAMLIRKIDRRLEFKSNKKLILMLRKLDDKK